MGCNIANAEHHTIHKAIRKHDLYNSHKKEKDSNMTAIYTPYKQTQLLQGMCSFKKLSLRNKDASIIRNMYKHFRRGGACNSCDIYFRAI